MESQISRQITSTIYFKVQAINHREMAINQASLRAVDPHHRILTDSIFAEDFSRDGDELRAVYSLTYGHKRVNFDSS
jgi:hypothetical protein